MERRGKWSTQRIVGKWKEEVNDQRIEFEGKWKVDVNDQHIEFAGEWNSERNGNRLSQINKQIHLKEKNLTLKRYHKHFLSQSTSGFYCFQYVGILGGSSHRKPWSKHETCITCE